MHTRLIEIGPPIRTLHLINIAGSTQDNLIGYKALTSRQQLFAQPPQHFLPHPHHHTPLQLRDTLCSRSPRIRVPTNGGRITNRILAVSGFHETTDPLGDPALAGLVVLVSLPERADRGEGSTYPLDAYGTIEVPAPAGTPI